MGIAQVEDAAWFTALRIRHASPRIFVETGTGTGTLTRLALEQFAVVYTIELSEALVEQYHPDLEAAGAKCYAGDSAVIVSSLARAIQEPVFWYLDAHWFDGGPDVAYSELPLLKELEAIAGRTYADVVVVDDVNCFGHGPQPEWDAISIERIAGMFPTAREVTVLGDQLAIYR